MAYCPRHARLPKGHTPAAFTHDLHGAESDRKGVEQVHGGEARNLTRLPESLDPVYL